MKIEVFEKPVLAEEISIDVVCMIGLWFVWSVDLAKNLPGITKVFLPVVSCFLLIVLSVAGVVLCIYDLFANVAFYKRTSFMKILMQKTWQ